MLTSGCAPPLDEDWCLCRIEWVGRRVFERGYWKSGKEEGEEVKVLEALEPVEGAQTGSDDIQVTLHYRVVLSYVFVIIQNTNV